MGIKDVGIFNGTFPIMGMGKNTIINGEIS
jgi:hypothetical protein